MRHSIKFSDQKLIILLLIDLIIIFGTTLFSLWIHARGLASLTFNFAYLVDQIGWLILLSSLWLIAAYINGLYDPIRSATLDKIIFPLLQSGTIVMVVYLLIFFYSAPESNLAARHSCLPGYFRFYFDFPLASCLQLSFGKHQIYKKDPDYRCRLVR